MCTTLYNPIQVNLSLYNSDFSLVPFLHFLASSSLLSLRAFHPWLLFLLLLHLLLLPQFLLQDLACFTMLEVKTTEEPHFLQACFLCRKPLGQNRDIFMYRGNTPFCSKECRQEQIENDEAKEKSWKLSSKRGVRQSENSQNSSTTNKAVRTGTVAVA